MPKLTQKRLKELLHYEPEIGIFTRLTTVSNYKAKKGDIAGCINKRDGYKRIVIDSKSYKSARLAWLYVEGYFPENDVDHKNRIRHDDRWENLRHVSRQCNIRNCGISKRNKSGIIGVDWDKDRRKWRSQINIFGKIFNLGRFKNKVDAVRARWRAEVKHGFPNCNSTSTAYLYLNNKKLCDF